MDIQFRKDYKGLNLAQYDVARIMRVAIVGASTLTQKEAYLAKLEIIKILDIWYDDLTLVSGGSKGIDTIAENVAKDLNIPTQIFPAETFHWEDQDGKKGFKTRNIQIAENCDVLYCFPAGTRDKKCYHCDLDHQVGGGCWTMKKAKKLGKETKLIQLIDKTSTTLL